MKNLKLITASLLALAAAGSAFAADLGTVHLTGSSAFRSATLNATKALFKTSGAHPLKYGWAGSGSFTGSTYAIFDGELLTGDTVIIATNFTGSAAGIQAIVQTAPVLSIPYLNTAYASLSTGGTSGLATPVVTATSDIAMSDVQVGLTPFQRDTDKGVVSPVDAPVGVIPFYWVANNGSNAAITNITNQMGKAVGAGGIPLSFWTGNNADTGLVRVVGRNADSGTRLTAYEEADYGAATPVTQYQPTPVSNTVTGGTITGLQLYPAETVLGITFGAGKSGYSSGGTLANQFQRPSAAGINFVGYVGRSDAIAAISSGTGRLLSYNGVLAPLTGTQAQLDAPFINGTYSFWSYEQMYITDDHAGSGDAVETVSELLATQIKTVNASASGIPLSDMKVLRSGEGQVITN